MEPFGRVFFKISLINLRFAQKRYSVFVHLHKFISLFLCDIRFLITPSLLPTGKRILLPHFEKKFPFHLYLMGEVIFEVFFETFSKHLHLFGMGMGILQPQTKNFSSLVHKNMYSIKNYPLTLNAKKSREI